MKNLIRKVLTVLKADPSGKLLLSVTIKFLKHRYKPRQDFYPNQFIDEPTTTSSREGRTLLVAHIFYPEYVDRLLRAIQSENSELINKVIVTTSSNHIAGRLQKEKARFPKRLHNLEIQRYENIGRNFYPFMEVMKKEYKNFDYVIHVHSKVSKHTKAQLARKWANRQWQVLLEDKDILARALQILDSNSDAAIVYPYVADFLPIWGYGWLANKTKAESILKSMGYDLEDKPFSYPAGGMFIARTNSFSSLFEFNWDEVGYPLEKGQLDGTTHHVQERLFGYLPNQLGSRQAVFFNKYNRFSFDTSFVSPLGPRLMSLTFEKQFSSVSFDFFDTLYRRAISHPDAPKILGYANLSGNTSMGEALLARESAERGLRQIRTEDATLADITSEMSRQLDLEFSILEKLEEDAELKLARSRAEVVSLCNRYAASGVPVYIISDTFYSSAFIRTLCRIIGVDERVEIIASSDVGKRKDTSELWRWFLSEKNIGNPESHLHYGDNFHSDNQIPNDLGITTRLVWSAQDSVASFESFRSKKAQLPKIINSENMYLFSMISNIGELFVRVNRDL